MARAFEGQLTGEGLRFAIVVSRFNEFITSKLLGGAQDALARHGVSLGDVDTAWVPGAFEVPFVAKHMAETGRYDGVICYGEWSPRNVGIELNYLAYSHFCYHPLDSLRQFADAQLAHRVGGADLAQEFVELLCKKDGGELTSDDRQRIRANVGRFMDGMIHTNATVDHPSEYSVDHFDNFFPYSYWQWLSW